MSLPVGHPGVELFAIVEQYEEFGDHRTGTGPDHLTAAWMGDRLRAAGLVARVEAVPFDRWAYTSTLTVAGDAVDHLPVFYEWTGEVNTANVWVDEVDQRLGGDPGVIDRHVAAARARGAEAVILATKHPTGSLVAINRPIGRVSGGMPTVLVPGRELNRLRRGPVQLTACAELVPATTTNIVAVNAMNAMNAMDGPRLVLTTPLTGWFGCAGERGTGIAVLLDLVARFAATRPLTVVCTGGHELGWFGADQIVDQIFDSIADGGGERIGPSLADISSIVHLGASLAAEQDGANGRQLAPNRLALTSCSDRSMGQVRASLSSVGLSLTAESSFWVGEGEAWSRLAAPLLSVTGAGVAFHTPEDVAAAVTSPGALRRVADAVADATAAFDDLARLGGS